MAASTLPATMPYDTQATTVLQVAERLYSMEPEWVVYFREVLGMEGVVRRTFRDPDELSRFECSPQYARIREMLDTLRSRHQTQPSAEKPQRVLTIRMPRSLHETLKNEAGLLQVSVNTLCVSKLMKLLDEAERREFAAERVRGAAGGIDVSAAQLTQPGADL